MASHNAVAWNSNEFLIQSAITIAMIFVALMLGSAIQPWGTKVSLSILEVGAITPTIYTVSGVWLVLGAVSMSYLLFGWRALPAVFVGFHLAAMYVYGWSLNPFSLDVDGQLKTYAWANQAHALVTTLGPLAAILTMRVFRLSHFFEGEKLIFQHVIFLMILAAFYNTFSKFFIETTLKGWIDVPAYIDEETYIASMLIGDLTGGIGFIFVLALVVVPIIRMVAPKSIVEN